MKLEFKLFLTEGLNDYVQSNGNIVLYHFSQHGSGPEMVVEPKHFGKGGYSMREKKTSDFPRSFFYVNLDHKEGFFDKTPLYQVEIPASKIYNLMLDPEKILDYVQSTNNGAMNYTMVFQKIMDSGYQGVYYGHSPEIVNLFVPIKCSRVETSVSRDAPQDQIKYPTAVV